MEAVGLDVIITESAGPLCVPDTVTSVVPYHGTEKYYACQYGCHAL